MDIFLPCERLGDHSLTVISKSAHQQLGICVPGINISLVISDQIGCSVMV